MGSSSKDNIKTDDHEIGCITVCNPYSNVTFKDVTITLSIILDEKNKAVSTLSDGTPSVMVIPSRFICFGEIPLCNLSKKDDNNQHQQLSCVSRQVGVLTRGAKQGKYKIQFTFCYSYEFCLLGKDEFVIELVKS